MSSVFIPQPVAMYYLRLLLLTRNLTDHRPSHDVFLVTACNHKIWLTTHLVTVYSLQRVSLSQDPAVQLPNHNVFTITGLIALRFNRQPTQSRCIPCDGFRRRLELQPIAHLVTMHSLQWVSSPRDSAGHPPNHDVFLATGFNTASGSNQPPTQSRCICSGGFCRLGIQSATHPVTMYSLRQVSTPLRGPANHPLSHDVFVVVGSVASGSNPPSHDVFLAMGFIVSRSS